MANPRSDARRALRDRVRGLYGMVDSGACDDVEALAAALISGGCSVVQVRCKGWSRSAVVTLTRSVLQRAAATGCLVIVNDDAEAAALADAHGVHVGQTDAGSDIVRAIVGPSRIIGRSTNRLADVDALAADPEVDYAAFGPVYPTAHLSRPKDVQGLGLLADARRRLPAGTPLVAIGGITAERLAEVRTAGADAWAVIGAITHAADRAAAITALRG
jgi:thiamine-phosphate pyrophosphorylase